MVSLLKSPPPRARICHPSSATAFCRAYEQAVKHTISEHPGLLAEEVRACRQARISHCERWQALLPTDRPPAEGVDVAHRLICQHLAEREQLTLSASF
jgi:hypothetical protein